MILHNPCEFHSNGYSLIRKILEVSGADKNEELAGRTIGEHLLEPTKIYIKSALKMIEKHDIHAIPAFFFNGDSSNGGPFRGGGAGGHAVSGSGSVDQFVSVFEQILVTERHASSNPHPQRGLPAPADPPAGRWHDFPVEL